MLTRLAIYRVKFKTRSGEASTFIAVRSEDELEDAISAYEKQFELLDYELNYHSEHAVMAPILYTGVKEEDRCYSSEDGAEDFYI